MYLMLPSRPCARCWIILLTMAGLLGGATRGRSQANDPYAISDIVGSILAPSSAMGFVSIPPTADRGAIRASLERLWGVALRNPALNPPKGFDVKPSLMANGLLSGPREPFIYIATGLLYWYAFMPAIGRVSRISVSDHAFDLTANLPTMVFADKWGTDGEGTMYYEPREIRRVAGYPQYSNGVVAVSNSSRPLWTPVPRERALRHELAVARANVEAANSTLRDAAAYDPAAQLAAWLRDRPQRQRDANEVYERTKKQDPQLAEKIRANYAKVEEQTEKALRQVADRNKTQPPVVVAKMQKDRQDAEACVSYLEGELARLSPADRKADAYFHFDNPRTPQGCSHVVEPGLPGATRIVAANSHFFDTTLPRTTLQLIVVDFGNFEMASYPRSGWKHNVYESLREGMDYKALAGMLVKR